MGMSSRAKLAIKVFKASYLLALVVTGLLTFYVARFLPEGEWAVYAGILLFYHLFLAWLLIDTSRGVRISLPPGTTLATHAACLMVVVGFAAGHRSIPFFAVLQYGVAVLAVFERYWLLRVSTLKDRVPSTGGVSGANAPRFYEATAADYEAWVDFLAKRNPLLRKPGKSTQQEYEEWLAARLKARAKAAKKEAEMQTSET